LHDKGIAHRDLKPENIIFEDYDNNEAISIKLIDFGLSKMLGID
jgi:serine/threonine protein kinase